MTEPNVLPALPFPQILPVWERVSYAHMAGPSTPAAPDVEVLVAEEVEERLDNPWRVILFNDEIHTFEEVTGQIVKATGCSPAQAEAYAWQAHTQGKAAVYEAGFEDCLMVQGILQEIGLVTEIEG